MHEGIVADQPLFDCSSSVDFKDRVQNLEKKTALITGYDVLQLC